MANDNYEVTRENLLNLQVCSNVPPGRKAELDALVNALEICGTSAGWRLDYNIEPVECAANIGHWHYIFSC
ncbi:MULTISPECIES: hypothetical protein [Pelosinus]|uniref:Uncharacterized protein n=1 Tax=Pelosinus fermentans B4 TaxID=1149862 RepID=I9LHU2_9FIRM|nr:MULTISPECIES: hypothetical protein [Pelosinus]EIW19956.1 hypothetical protein FB4_0207 [Pelosinus fermentans B4]EIW21187.1 hypothetical protein FA11_0914 [Pelosinus fermentans A11]